MNMPSPAASRQQPAAKSPIGVLVMAYGGPDRLEDVEPYLLDVRAGRITPPEVVHEVRERYRAIGGRSPILERTREQAAALESALNDGSGSAYKTFVGMRHWQPFIRDVCAQMTSDGIQRSVGLVMAPHYSRMSVGAYYKRVDEAGVPIELARIERWHALPGYVQALAERVGQALGRFPAEMRGRVPVIFTAHSLPQRILEWGDAYPQELRETVDAVVQRLEPAAGAGRDRYHFAYQSAAMTPDPWLGPDAGDVIERLAREGHRHVLIAPIGFVCEHVEILYDVDIVFKRQAQALGVQLERIEMLNAAPAMIAGLAGLVRDTARQAGWL